MATTISRTWYDTLVDDDGSGTTGSIWDKADVDSFLDAIDALLAASIQIDGSLTLDQLTADGECLLLKSTGDVAHGLTSGGAVATSTATWLSITKRSGTEGTPLIQAVSASTTNRAFDFHGFTGPLNATKSTAGVGGFTFNVIVHDGANGIPNPITVDGNAYAFRVNSGTGLVTRFILDVDGDSHQDVGTAWTNFSTHDDVALLAALSAGVSRQDDPVTQQFGSFLHEHRHDLERLKIVTFNDGPDGDAHPFVNMSKLSMLLVGAAIQSAQRITAMEKRRSWWRMLVTRLLPEAA